MTFVDFSYWAVTLVLAGSVLKYLFSDTIASMQQNYERQFTNREGYDMACGVHPLVKGMMSFDKYRLSAEYSETNYRFGIAAGWFDRTVGFAIFALCAYPQAMKWFGQFQFFADNPIAVLIGTSVAVDAVMTIAAMPFSLYDTFVIEKRFGFNTQTVGCWLSDLVKDFTIGAAYSSVAIAIAYYGMLAFTRWICPELTSVYFIASVVGVQVVFGLFWESLYIGVIAPMFNKFTPLEDGHLKDRITALISETGYSVSGIFVMDAGRRSRHSNAYFTGWGRSKRIVLYDTLLDAHTEDEILAILGHEAGHLVHGDIMRGRIVDAAYSALKTVAAVLMVSNVGFYRAFGFDFVTAGNITHWYVAGWWFAEIVMASVEWIATPVWSALSRRDEYAADRWSAERVGADAMSASLVRLYAENLSGMHDHPFYEFWYYDHPCLKNRVNAINAVKSKHD